MAANLVIGALQIVAPVLLCHLIAGCAQGGFICFFNADIVLEVQTPENLASASGSITSMVVLAISAVVGIIASLLNIKKAA